MKYTDQWFKFPVRVYDPMTVRRAVKKEDEDGIREDGDWVLGVSRIHPDDISSWDDYFTRDVLPLKEGFSCNATLVFLKNGEDRVCTWDRIKFENKLDSFVEKHNTLVLEERVKEDEELRKMAEEETNTQEDSD